MRNVLIAGLLGFSVLGQVVIDPAKIPKRIRDLEPLKDEKPLQCEVQPFKPRVDFGFRFQAGYVLRVPMRQYFGKGHAWATLIRITPEERDPVFLLAGYRLPDVPKTTIVSEVGGSYLLGEGRYSVDLMLYDDSDRICRKRWRVQAKRDRSERNIAIRLPAGGVRSLGSRGTPGQASAEKRPYRITVLVHASPLFPRATHLRTFDRQILLGTLAPLLELLPAQSVRLVVFNLDQQKTLLARERFRPENLNQVAEALSGLELGVVNYNVLQHPGGHLDLLAELINNEMVALDRSDAVIFLGPMSRYFDKFPSSALVARGESGPQLFYLRYAPFGPRGADFPDVIQNAVKAMKGRVMTVHTPAEFAKAIQQMDSRLLN